MASVALYLFFLPFLLTSLLLFFCFSILGFFFGSLELVGRVLPVYFIPRVGFNFLVYIYLFFFNFRFTVYLDISFLDKKIFRREKKILLREKRWRREFNSSRLQYIYSRL